MNKILSIQKLRGVAASLVCMVHLMAGSPQYLGDLPVLRDAATYGVYGVQIFFVISGFVLPYSLYKSRYHISRFGGFLLRRIARIDPPYLLSIAVVITLAYISTLSPYYRGKPVAINWTDVALHLGYMNSFFDRPWLSPVYWTLAIEFQFYILLGLCFDIFQRGGMIVRTIIIVLFLTLSLLIKDHSYIFCQAPFFLMGIFAFLYFEKLVSGRLLLAVVVVFMIVGGFSFDWPATFFAAATVPAILFWNSPSRFWLFIGTISYSLYLLHVPVGSRVTNLTEALTDNTFIRLMMVAGAYAISVVAAYIFYRMIEVPSIELSKRVALRKA